MEPLVTPDWLLRHLEDPAVRIVDCRFVLGEPDEGRRRYLERSIPGAVFADLDTELAGPVGDGLDGRHPLPSVQRFTEAARTAGISAQTHVVAYDDARTGGAARLWWLLRHFGHPAVSVLDGGLAGWTGPTQAGATVVARGDFVARRRDDDTVDLAGVEAGLRRPGRILVDARAPERFRGEVEPIDPLPGHIPGARNAPFNQPPASELVQADAEVVVYCGSGVTACEVLLRLAAAGNLGAKLYPGSYSEWTNRGLPVEQGG